MTKTRTENPEIYVASLSDYNDGNLLGVWIDLDINGFDADMVMEDIQAMLKTSKQLVAEEWAIHDYQGFMGLQLGENPDLETLCDIAKAISEHGPAMAAFLNYDPSYNTPDMFEDVYRGTFDSVAEFAQEMTDDLGTEIPASIEPYIDYERWGNDMLMDSFYSIDGDRCIYVFWRN